MRLYKSLIFCYLLIGLVPYLGAADKIHPQSLYLSILNITCLCILYFKSSKELLKGLKYSVSHKPSLFYFAFVIFSIVSLFQSVNIRQSFIGLSEIFSQFLALLILIFLLSKINNLKKLFFQYVILLSSIELASTLYPYLKDISDFGSPVYRSLKYRGYSGSVNILTYLLLMKLPFLFYFSLRFKRYKWFYIVLSSLTIYAITSIFLSRSSMIATILVIIALTAIFIYNHSIDKNNKYYKPKNIIISVLIPVVFNILINNIQPSFFQNSETIQDRLSTISIDEYSANSRFRYYKHAIQSILKNPLTGVGINNWQLVSIDYDRENIGNYIVPYHAHNDFLEISSESGIQGGISYYLVILIPLFFLFKKCLNHLKKNEEVGYDFMFLTAITVYIFDSMFNFPFGRVLQQVNILFFVAFIINYSKLKPVNINNKLFQSILLIMIISFPLVLYSNIRMMKSSMDQKIILSHYNLADYSLPLSDIDEFDLEYSDITVTTLPMKSMKGFFYMRNSRFREAIEFFNEGTSRNPFLYYSETYKGFCFLNIGELDSALYYTELAFNKLPGNVVHFGNYAVTLAALKDSVKLKEAYEKAKYKDNIHDEVYLASMSDIFDRDEGGFILDNINFDIQSGSDNLKRSYYTLRVGENDMIAAAKYNELGDYLFLQKEYISAEEYFEMASKLNPYEDPYQENYANANLQIGNFQKAANILENLIEKSRAPTIKAKFMLALAYLNQDDTKKACPIIQKIKNSDQLKSADLQRFCN